MGTYAVEVETLSLGILLARLVVGLVMAAHGTQKLFGWFGGFGLSKSGEYFAQLGFAPGRAFAAAASLGEIVSGLLVAFGFLGPVGPALMICVMVVAMISVHWQNGLFAQKGGIEVALLYAVGAYGVALTGYGRYSLDASLGLASRWTTGATWAWLIAGVLGGFVNLALRRRSGTVRA